MTFVITHCGQVQGKKVTSSIGTSYLSFTGIPYMKQPVGNLRFRDPQPLDPWQGTQDCTKPIESYCNYDQKVVLKIGKEDAAFLNVYVPDRPGNKILPVLVNIHGGGFQSMSSKHEFSGPDYWMERDVVLVTFNYRLGPLGFLSLKDPELNIPGNMGLKDQVAALKWIQNNIEAFGGDSENVTLCGESAGAVSVHLHMLSEKSKNLFHKAIMISGSAFDRSWSVMSGNEDFAERLAMKCGWDGNGGEAKILEVLEHANSHALMKHSSAVNFLSDDEFAQFMIFTFTPVVEPFSTENCFLPKDPRELAEKAWSKDIPCIMGGSGLEGTMCDFLKRRRTYVDLLQSVRYFTPARELKIDLQKAMQHGGKLRKLYYGSVAPSIKDLKQFLEYAGDRQIWHGLYNAIKSRAKLGNGKTFAFYFDADTELNLFKKVAIVNLKGATHADMGMYLFSSSYLQPPTRDSVEFRMISELTKLFESFFKFGIPDARINGVEWSWKAVNSDGIECLKISEDKFEMVQLPVQERLEVWNSIYREENVRIF